MSSTQPPKMPSIGPSMPPQPSKRGRDGDDDRSSSPDASDKRRRVAGPALPHSTASPPRTAGPTLPPTADSRSSSPGSDVGPAPLPVSKSKRVMGPAAPPAPLDERPPSPPSDDSDSSDDDFGPAPPRKVLHTVLTHIRMLSLQSQHSTPTLSSPKRRRKPKGTTG